MFFILTPLVVVAFFISMLELRYRAVYGYGMSTVVGMSWASKVILEGYHDLPEDNRPHANIVHILDTLDERLGKKAINQHFTSSSYGGGNYKTITRCPCPTPWNANSPCPYRAYTDMYNGISSIKTTIAAREKAVLESKTGFIDDINTFKEDLERERSLVAEQRKELSR